MENIRAELVGHVTAYLQDKIEAKELSLWFFNLAASPDFEDLEHIDPLSRDIILDVLKVHEKTGKMPPRQNFQDYLEYCAGRKMYQALPEDKERPKQDLKVVAGRAVRWSGLILIRAYITVFALISLTVNLFLWQRPGFFETPTHLYSLITQAKTFFPPELVRSFYCLASNPQVFYFLKVIQPRHELTQVPFFHCLFALLALLPSRFLTRNVIFTIAFPVLGLGTLYYWYITWDMSAKMAYIFSWERTWSCLFVSGFIALPATLVFVLLVLNAYQFHADRER